MDNSEKKSIRIKCIELALRCTPTDGDLNPDAQEVIDNAGKIYNFINK